MTIEEAIRLHESINKRKRLLKSMEERLRVDEDRLQRFCPHPPDYIDYDSLSESCELCGNRLIVL